MADTFLRGKCLQGDDILPCRRVSNDPSRSLLLLHCSMILDRH